MTPSYPVTFTRRAGRLTISCNFPHCRCHNGSFQASPLGPKTSAKTGSEKTILTFFFDTFLGFEIVAGTFLGFEGVAGTFLGFEGVAGTFLGFEGVAGTFMGFEGVAGTFMGFEGVAGTFMGFEGVAGTFLGFEGVAGTCPFFAALTGADFAGLAPFPTVEESPVDDKGTVEAIDDFLDFPDFPDFGDTSGFETSIDFVFFELSLSGSGDFRASVSTSACRSPFFE
jgi:hypothetical protein